MVDALVSNWLKVLLGGLFNIGTMLFIFWYWKPEWTKNFRIHQPRNISPKFKTEFLRSLFGLSVFAIPTVIEQITGFTKMYTNVETHGWFYFILTPFIFAFWVDTWFYWTHRLMHSVSFLRPIHQIHHRSYNLNPASSYSFHFIEALINMSVYAVILFLIPWHPVAVAIFSSIAVFYQCYIHLGFDIPEKWRAIPPMGIFYSSTQHAIHHHTNGSNYGVYFSFWDKIMKTEVQNPSSRTFNK